MRVLLAGSKPWVTGSVGFNVCLIVSLLMFMMLTNTQALAQEAKASWIAATAEPKSTAEVLHFRKSLSLNAKPASFAVRISADNQFRLFVNGVFVAAGPDRSDIMHWRYENVDLAPFLQAGQNTIAVTVWNWGEYRPVAQHSYRTGLYLQGMSAESEIVNSSADWKVYQDNAYQFLPVSGETVGGYYAASPGEQINAEYYPWGWETNAFDDSNWQSVYVMPMPPVIRGEGAFGVAVGWQLMPSTLPQMEEKPVRFNTVRKAQGIALEQGFIIGKQALSIAPHSQVKLLLDQAHLTNAYAVLDVSGGKGSEIKLTYAEALKDANGDKGNRNEIEGKTLFGLSDTILPDGQAHRRYQSLWFRTYRYVEMSITTANEALHINDFHGIFTGYPFELVGNFASDVSWLDNMWEMNWRIARLCAFDTYFDTPYYEQLQYIGDTRIQALITLYLSGDDRLVRQAISHFNDSLIPEGLTASRYPSNMAQYIPPFSLIWIMMVNDYWMLRDDPQYVKNTMPAIRQVLAWFEGHIASNGLLGPIPWWPFGDWVPSWEHGMPPGAQEGGSSMLSLQFVYALQKAAELENALGTAGQAKRYTDLADNMLKAVNTLTWDEKRQMYRDTPTSDNFSQQTNIMAVLSNAIATDKQAVLLNNILHDSTLAQATYYFKFYLFEALEHAGLGDSYLQQLSPWQDMLQQGLTTTPENPDPTRSDSHAWAAHPNYGLLSIVLGVRPHEPGFNSVRIAPKLGELQQAAGTIAHPLGNIEVKFQRKGDKGISANISLPQGLYGIFEWNEKQIKLHSGKQQIIL